MNDEHTDRYFVVYIEPGKIAQKKGPFRNADQVETMLVEMRPHYHADTRYIVAQIAYGPDLWLTEASEFLFFREPRTPKERALKRYPKAYGYRWGDGYYVTESKESGYVLATGPNARSAWAAVAKRAA